MKFYTEKNKKQVTAFVVIWAAIMLSIYFALNDVFVYSKVMPFLVAGFVLSLWVLVGVKQ